MSVLDIAAEDNSQADFLPEIWSTISHAVISQIEDYFHNLKVHFLFRQR